MRTNSIEATRPQVDEQRAQFLQALTPETAKAEVLRTLTEFERALLETCKLLVPDVLLPAVFGEQGEFQSNQIAFCLGSMMDGVAELRTIIETKL